MAEAGGGSGASTIVQRNDGITLKGKGKQFIPEDTKVQLAFPGGGGYGNALDRDKLSIKEDLRLGYISEKSAKNDYNLSKTEIKIALSKDKP